MANTESPQKDGNYLLGNGCMLLAVIFWGLNIPVTKVLIPEWMSANGVSAVRLIGGCLLFWLTSLFIKCEPIRRGDWLKIFLGGFVGLFLFIFLFIMSLRYGSAIDISIILTLPPMFVILIGVLFLHKRPSITEYLGVAISFVGAVIVIAGGYGQGSAGTDNILGDLLAILSALCFAIYLVILQKPSKDYSPLALLRWVYLFAALPAIFLVPGMQDMPLVKGDPGYGPWLEIGFILLCPTFFAYFLTPPAIKNIGAELCSIYQYLIPVVAAIAAVLMGIEKIRVIQLVAMGVIVAGMILTNVGKKRAIDKK